MYREGLILDKTRCKSSVIGNENAKDLFQHRINGFADTFLRLSKTINNTTGEQVIMDIGQVDIDNIFEELSEKMCRTCKNCKHCWEEEFDATYEATCFMFKVAEENGYIDHKDIPINFLETCIIADKYVSEANKGFELAKINRNWSNKLKENRDVIADQLEEVSNAMSDFSKELTKYKVLTGVARGIKEKVSGDNFSIMKLNSGDTMIALSDGMGTGKKAFKESDLVITLLEQFMDAGFNARAAIKLINSSLVLKNREQSFTTVDLSVINLYTGICQFIKIGASTTFIKRGTWVETICSTTMPVDDMTIVTSIIWSK